MGIAFFNLFLNIILFGLVRLQRFFLINHCTAGLCSDNDCLQDCVTLQLDGRVYDWPTRVAVLGYGIGKSCNKWPDEVVDFLAATNLTETWEIRLNRLLSVWLLDCMCQLLLYRSIGQL